MKFTIMQENLLHVLSTVHAAIENKSTLPILANVLLATKGNILTVTATDLEIEQIDEAQIVDSDVDYSITVPARKLMDITKSLPQDKIITITLKDDNLEVKSGRSRYKLATMPADDYPNIQEQHKILHSFNIEPSDLLSLINDGSFAMANQDVRYYLNGALFKATSELIQVVSTDGHRLACSKRLMSSNLDMDVDSIIPRKGVLHLQKLLGTLKISVFIEISSNHFRLTANGSVFTTKLVDGNYPDYKRVIPKDESSDIKIAINSQLLKTHLMRASILSNEKTRGIKLAISNNTLSIYGNNPEQENSEEVLDIDYSGNSFEIGFNSSYLLDAINHVVTDDVLMVFKDVNATMRILPSNGSALSCIMPMRL